MEKRANYAFVGVSMVVMVTALIALVLWLSIGWNHKSYQTYVVYMNQAVMGLKVQSSVNFNGVSVGTVDKIELNAHDPQQVKLYLKILDNTPITTSTVATLANQGITGISYVSLSAKSPDAPELKPAGDEEYAVIPSVPSFFVQLDTLINRTSDSMQALLSPENLQNINKTLHNLQVITDKMANNMDVFMDIAKNVKVITDSVVANSDAIDNVIHNADATSANLNQLSMQGKFALGSMTDLILKLNAMSAELNQLLNMVQSNPSILVRGTDQIQSGPGE